MGSEELEKQRLELESARLAFDRERHRNETTIAVRKIVATGIVTAIATIGIPWLVSDQNVKLERLKLNAASVEHVQAVLRTDLDPDSRRRIYEYLVTAFEGTPLHHWAKLGLDTSQKDLAAARKEVAETKAQIAEAKKNLEAASARALELEEALKQSNDQEKKRALEQELAATRQKVSEESVKLSTVSVSGSSPAELNATGLQSWNGGEQTKARELFSAACDRDYWPACFNLAGVLHRGREQNWAAASELYKKGCDQRLARACTDLGDLQVQQGFEGKAVEFYRRGCELGDRRGCDELSSRGVALPPTRGQSSASDAARG